MTDTPGPDLLTVAEVARMLRVSDQLVRDYITRGDLVAYRLSERAIRVDPAELRAFMTSRRSA